MSKIFCQFLYGETAVADGVLDFQGHLGETDGKAVGHKDRVITKTFAVSMPLRQNLSVDSSFEIVNSTLITHHSTLITSFHQTDNSTEASPTVRLTLQCRQQFVDVVVKRAVLSGITRRIDPRRTAQSLHLKTSIISKHPVIISGLLRST